MAYLYRHIRLDKNEPFYIGIGCTIYRAYDFKRRSKWWKRIYDKTDIEVDIIFDNLTKEEVREKEKEFIALYGRKDLKTGTLVNMTDGGDGALNAIIREETREKKRQRIVSLETKMKLSERMKKNTYSKGHKPSKEVIEKRRQGILKRGYKHPPEVIEKINKTKKERGAKAKIVFDSVNGIYYSSAVEAAELLKIPLITIQRICKGKTKRNKKNINLKYV
jgi:hypothetical protein